MSALATVAGNVQDRIHAAAHCEPQELRVAARLAELWAQGEMRARASIAWYKHLNGDSTYIVRVRRAPKEGHEFGILEDIP